MSIPTYKINRNQLVMLCDTNQSNACAELIMRKDKNGGVHSDWWGHPTTRVLMDGTTIVTLPCNAHNIGVLYNECGAEPDCTDEVTRNRISFFRLNTKKKPFESPLPLKPFQVEGADWLVRCDLRRMLSYTMGLGKTITSIAAMLSNPEMYLPAVVLAPAHIKLNWAGEWEKWGGDPNDIVVLFGRTPNNSLLKDKKLIVINHHIINGWCDALVEISPKTVIIDEAHNFVNSKSKTYPLVERITKACGKRVLLLTATPLVNNLDDLWGLCNLISIDILGTKAVFVDTFIPEEKAKARLLSSRWRGGFDKQSWRTVAMARLPKAIMSRRLEQLNAVLHKHVMLRKTKEDVMDELPDITETHLRLDVSRTTEAGRVFWSTELECEMEISEAKEDVLSSDKLLGAFSRARRNAVNAKIEDATAWIEDFLSESDPTEKVVVVGWSVEPLESLHRHFKRHSVIVNGKIDARKKRERGDTFTTDPDKRILFGNVKSIGTGIDLVAARTMLLIELPLTSVDLEQVKARIDRISQTSKALSYYYMTIRGSIEEKMVWKIINRKQKLAKSLGLG